MEKEQVYIQRIKDLQEELTEKDRLIEALRQQIQFYEENAGEVIDKASFNQATAEAKELVKTLKEDLHEIRKLKAELAQKIYATYCV